MTEFINSPNFWSGGLKVLLATSVFAVYRVSTSSPLLYRYIGRARGMLLTFPVLNGVGLVMAQSGSAETKAAAMFPMIGINGLLFSGYLLNFELASSHLPTSRFMPATIGFVAMIVWGLEAKLGFSIPPRW